MSEHRDLGGSSDAAGDAGGGSGADPQTDPEVKDAGPPAEGIADPEGSSGAEEGISGLAPGGVRRERRGADPVDRVLAHALPDEARVASCLVVKSSGVHVSCARELGKTLHVSDGQRPEANEVMRGVLRERGDAGRCGVVFDVRPQHR